MLGDEWNGLATGELYHTYEEWISSLMREPVWSPASRSGRRIPWRIVLNAPDDELQHPGLYLFGSALGVPRYIGKAETESLRDRLSHRYLSGPFSQFHLAMDHSDLLRTGGWKALPDHVLARYLREQSRRLLKRKGWLDLNDEQLAQVARSGMGTKVRLRHAEDLASNGIEGIWIGLIPCGEGTVAGQLERKLIPLAAKWNRDKGFAPLLNKQSL